MQEIRALITKECNFGCTFCHKEGLDEKRAELLSPSGYGLLAAAGKLLGMETITLTGGEPLLRKDVADITREIGSQLRQTITTNGYLLNARMGINVTKLNVSVHSTDSDIYKGITGVNGLGRVNTNLINFKEKHPDTEIVLNNTLIEGINSSEESMENLFDMAQKISARVKFVELYPQGSSGYIDNEELAEKLTIMGFERHQESLRKMNFSRNGLGVALTRIFCSQARLENNPAEYCNRNNDLFLSPDGIIQNCREELPSISIIQELKEKDIVGVQQKIQVALATMGNNCYYNQHG